MKFYEISGPKLQKFINEEFTKNSWSGDYEYAFSSGSYTRYYSPEEFGDGITFLSLPDISKALYMRARSYGLIVKEIKYLQDKDFAENSTILRGDV